MGFPKKYKKFIIIIHRFKLLNLYTALQYNIFNRNETITKTRHLDAS